MKNTRSEPPSKANGYSPRPQTAAIAKSYKDRRIAIIADLVSENKRQPVSYIDCRTTEEWVLLDTAQKQGTVLDCCLLETVNTSIHRLLDCSYIVSIAGRPASGIPARCYPFPAGFFSTNSVETLTALLVRGFGS
jgi:hypothetical protein